VRGGVRGKNLCYGAHYLDRHTRGRTFLLLLRRYSSEGVQNLKYYKGMFDRASRGAHIQRAFIYLELNNLHRQMIVHDTSELKPLRSFQARRSEKGLWNGKRKCQSLMRIGKKKKSFMKEKTDAAQRCLHFRRRGEDLLSWRKLSAGVQGMKKGAEVRAQGVQGRKS